MSTVFHVVAGAEDKARKKGAIWGSYLVSDLVYARGSSHRFNDFIAAACAKGEEELPGKSLPPQQ